MGAYFSNFTEETLTNFALEEYEKQLTKKKEYLLLSDIMNIQLPEDYTFNFSHLG